MCGIATPDHHTDVCVSASMVFMFGLLIMHASMPRPKLAAAHSCCRLLSVAFFSSLFALLLN